MDNTSTKTNNIPASSAVPSATDLLDRAYKLQGSSDAEQLYDEWAAHYDQHFSTLQYASPRRCVDTALKYAPEPLSLERLRILDVGCGTGLVGDCLASSRLHGKYALDGNDISEGMLASARAKGQYRHLEKVDVSKGIQHRDGSYDMILCVGTLTKGHVGPKVLPTFARLTARAGIIVATVHGDVWEAEGYRDVVEEMQARGTVEVVSSEEFGITEGEEAGGRMIVLKKV